MSEQNSNNIEDITLEENDVPNFSDVVNYNPLGDNVEEKEDKVRHNSKNQKGIQKIL